MIEQLTFGSLFAGIGGFDLGLVQAGLRPLWYAEIDEKCNALMAERAPGIPNIGDVRNVKKETVPAVDVVVGGFPCQDVSVAGKRAGLAGKRSGLWFEFLRLITEARPQWAVIENVPGLLSSNGGRDFAVILSGLAQIGYSTAWRILDAQYYGVAQRRRRVFIVASLGNGRCAEVLFERQSLSWDSAPCREAGQETARRAKASIGIDSELNATREMMGTIRSHQSGGSELFVSQYGNIAGTLSRRHDSSPCADRGQNVIAYQCQGTNVGPMGTLRQGNGGLTGGVPFVCYGFSQESDGSTARNAKDLARPITGRHGDPGIVALIDNQPSSGVRRLTPTEAERLQGFPDGWTDNGQSDSARYRQLGNAVCVPVSRWIGQQIIKASLL